MKKIIAFIVVFLNSINLFAQQVANQEIEMADAMRANGKIYVVVVVIAILFVGIIAYLVRLDTKISKIEKHLQ